MNDNNKAARIRLADFSNAIESVIRHHAISHLRGVRPQRGGNRECSRRRLGQSRRRHRSDRRAAATVVARLFGMMNLWSVVPFMNRKGPGAVAGIVGVVGNVGSMVAAFLEGADVAGAGAALPGAIVSAVSLLSPVVRFSVTEESFAQQEFDSLLSPEIAVVGTTDD